MGVSDTVGADASLAAVPPASATSVRHFDQLSDREQRAFLELYRGDDPGPDPLPLSDGEVVVFTAYFRVEY